MIPTLDALKQMGRAVEHWASTQTPAFSSSEIRQARRYCTSIDWKLRFLEHHFRLVGSIDWSRLAEVDRQIPTSDGQRTEVHEIRCGDTGEIGVQLHRQHEGVFMSLVAVDGVVASCVNAADTLGRLLNLVFRLGVDQRRANLPLVSEEIQEASPLGRVLKQQPGHAWMVPIRSLRGECQHGDISAVLQVPDHDLGGVPSEPHVVADYCLNGTAATPLLAYAVQARELTLELIRNSALVLAASPSAALVPLPPVSAPSGPVPGNAP